MGLIARKPVFRISDNANFKFVCSATDTSSKIVISLEACLHRILFIKRITKGLIRLRECAGWSAPVLFIIPEDRYSHVEAHIVAHIFLSPNSTEEFKEIYSFVKLSLQRDYKKMTFKL